MKCTTPMPGRFKDYIAMPKPNMYQSSYDVDRAGRTAVRSADPDVEMHKTAEIGIAAHWKYKEGGKNGKPSEYDGKLEWVRNLLDNQKKKWKIRMNS